MNSKHIGLDKYIEVYSRATGEKLCSLFVGTWKEASALYDCEVLTHPSF